MKVRLAVGFLFLLLAFCDANSIRSLLDADETSSGSNLPPIGEVDGCFSSFSAKASTTFNALVASNLRCHRYCKDKGYIIAATQRSQCFCGNVYPQGSKVEDSKCDIGCGFTQASTCARQGCCGGDGYYTVGVVGDLNVPKQLLRRVSESVVGGGGTAIRKLLVDDSLKEVTALKDIDGAYLNCAGGPVSFEAKGANGDEVIPPLEIVTYAGETLKVPVVCSSTGSGDLTKSYQRCTPVITDPAVWAKVKNAKIIKLIHQNYKHAPGGVDRNIVIRNGQFWFFGKNIFRSAIDNTAQAVRENVGGRLNILRNGNINWRVAEMYVPPSSSRIWFQATGRSGRETIRVAAELMDGKVMEFGVRCSSTKSGRLSKSLQTCTANNALPGGISNVRRLRFYFNDDGSKNDIFIKDARFFLEGVNIWQYAQFASGGRKDALTRGFLLWTNIMAGVAQSDYQSPQGKITSSKSKESWQVILRNTNTPKYGETVTVALKNIFTQTYLTHANGVLRCDGVSVDSTSQFSLEFDESAAGFSLKTSSGTYIGKNAGSDFTPTFREKSSATLLKPKDLKLKALFPWLRVSVVMDNLLHSMVAFDETETTMSYTCEPLPSKYKRQNFILLDQVDFQSKDETATPILRVPLPDGRTRCENNDAENSLPCSFDYTKEVAEEATLEILTGSSVSIGNSVDATIGVEFGQSFSTSVTGGAFGVEVSAGTEVSWSSSISTTFNRASEVARSTERSNSKTKVSSTSTTYHFETEVPPKSTRTIQVFLSKVDIEYRWKATFIAKGAVDFSFGKSTYFGDDLSVARLLVPGTGSDEFFAMGKWSFPNQAVVIGTVSDPFEV